MIDKSPSIKIYNINSSGVKGVLVSKTVQCLEEYFDRRLRQSHLILAEDFNATFEPLNRNTLAYIRGRMRYGRSHNSICLLENGGLKLLYSWMLYRTRTRATNGWTKSDQKGAFTFNKPFHMSRIDYTFVDLRLWPYINDMVVRERLESDHNPLCLSMTAFCGRHFNNPQASPSLGL